jgi:hypothetical protein
VEAVVSDAVIWHLQVRQPPIPLKGGRHYQFSFRARADRPRNIAYGVQQDHEPWTNMGLWNTVRLAATWQMFHAVFVATTDEPAARLSFSVSGHPAAVELADVVLAPGGPEGLYQEESLEATNVVLYIPGEVPARTLDRLRFLVGFRRGALGALDLQFLPDLQDVGVGDLVAVPLVDLAPAATVVEHFAGDLGQQPQRDADFERLHDVALWVGDAAEGADEFVGHGALPLLRACDLGRCPRAGAGSGSGPWL